MRTHILGMLVFFYAGCSSTMVATGPDAEPARQETAQTITPAEREAPSSEADLAALAMGSLTEGSISRGVWDQDAAVEPATLELPEALKREFDSRGEAALQALVMQPAPRVTAPEARFQLDIPSDAMKGLLSAQGLRSLALSSDAMPPAFDAEKVPGTSAIEASAGMLRQLLNEPGSSRRVTHVWEK